MAEFLLDTGAASRLLRAERSAVNNMRQSGAQAPARFFNHERGAVGERVIGHLRSALGLIIAPALPCWTLPYSCESTTAVLTWSDVRETDSRSDPKPSLEPMLAQPQAVGPPNAYCVSTSFSSSS